MSTCVGGGVAFSHTAPLPPLPASPHVILTSLVPLRPQHLNLFPAHPASQVRAQDREQLPVPLVVHRCYFSEHPVMDGSFLELREPSWEGGEGSRARCASAPPRPGAPALCHACVNLPRPKDAKFECTCGRRQAGQGRGPLSWLDYQHQPGPRQVFVRVLREHSAP